MNIDKIIGYAFFDGIRTTNVIDGLVYVGKKIEHNVWHGLRVNDITSATV